MNNNQIYHEVQLSKNFKKSFSISSLQLDPNKLRHNKIISNNTHQISRGDSQSRMSYYDKEDQMDQIQRLKIENNQMKIELKQAKAQVKYYQKELEDLQNQIQLVDENSSSLQYQVKIKQLLKTVTLKQNEIESLKKKLRVDEINNQAEELHKLKTLCELQKQKLLNNQIDVLIPNQIEVLKNLEEDNIKLTKIVKELEEKNKSNEGIFKKNIIQLGKIKNQQQLIHQLQSELNKFKERDTLFSNKQNQQVKLEAVIQKLNYEINRLSSLLQEEQEKIDEMNKKMAKQQDKFEKIIMEKDEEILEQKIKIENLTKQEEQHIHSEQRGTIKQQFLFKPSLFQNINHKQENSGSSNRIQSIQNRQQQCLITKSDLFPIIQILKYQLFNNNVQLNQIDDYLFKNQKESNEIYLKLLIEQLQQSIFYLNKQQSISLGIYLIDSDQEDEYQNIIRVRSIFKALVDNYIVPSKEEKQQCKIELNKLFNEGVISLKQQLIQKYEHSIQKIQLTELYELMQNNEIKISKYAKEYLEATFFYLNNNTTNIFQIDQIDKLSFEQN